MDDEARPRKGPQPYQLGAPLDELSAGELQERIGALEAEIDRLRQAIAARGSSRSAADAFFKFEKSTAQR